MTRNNLKQNTRKTSRAGMMMKSLALPFGSLFLLLVSAGRWDYWQAWLFFGLNLIFIVASYLTLRGNPELVEERLQPGTGTKNWDRNILAISLLMYIAYLIIAGLDVGRFGWSAPQPWWAYLLGLLLHALGQVLFLWAKHTNSFFSSVVRIQTEREHQVCRSGPYRFVRHPGYAGSMIGMFAGPLLLGSQWALLPQMIALVLLFVRTALEDRTLINELPGYPDYASEVRCRLIPGIW